MAHDDLLEQIERFLAATGMGPSYFGSRAVGNSKLVKRLRLGRSIETATASKIKEYIEVETRDRLQIARSLAVKKASLA